MKILLTLAFTSAIFMANSQCCPYINNVEVLPSASTTADSILIATVVTTPNQGNFIQSTHTVNGNTINIEACYYSGMLTATQTYRDTLGIGYLAAGTYTVNFTAYQSSSETACNYADSMSTTLDFTVTDETNNIISPIQGIGELYPNPNSGNFSIKLPSHINPTHIRIHSISGKMVYEGNYTEKVSVQLERGMYLIRLMKHAEFVGYQRLLIR